MPPRDRRRDHWNKSPNKPTSACARLADLARLAKAAAMIRTKAGNQPRPFIFQLPNLKRCLPGAYPVLAPKINKFHKYQVLLANPTRFERVTFAFEGLQVVTRRRPKRSAVWRLRSYARPVAPPQHGALSGTCRFTFLASRPSKSPKVQILSRI